MNSGRYDVASLVERNRKAMNFLASVSTFSCVVVVLLIAAFTMPAVAGAQETTATIRGLVVDAAGAPIPNAQIEVLDQRTGVIRNFVTNDSGTFLATRLTPGGPYTVIVNQTQTVIVDSVGVADVYNLTIDTEALRLTEQVTVVGEPLNIVDVAAGPAATFSTYEMETAVSFSRDIVEVYGLDPRLNIDNEDDGFEVNCAGKHPRFNSVTLDGVGQNDRFGLNSNGYATAVGMPFPYDAISQIAVELAPADVTYGGFSACNINAVTKSGGNLFRGNAFFEHASDNLRGTKIGGETSDFSTPPYNARKFGLTAGGPIARDRLFFFSAYESTQSPRFLARGFAGSGTGTERPWLSQTDYSRIERLAKELYNYDPGGQPGDGAQEEDKFMVRLDWNANRSHNVSFISNLYDGFQDRDSDGGSNEFEFANHFYVKGAKSKTFTGKIASQWSNALSTEVFLSRNDMDDSQVTVGPKDFAEFQISLGNNLVYLGADDSRQANALNTDSTFFKFLSQYLAGKQILTAGYEREDLSIFNLFVQHSRGGEYRFFDSSAANPAFCAGLTPQGRLDDPSCGLSGIDRYELGRPSRIVYGSGGGTNNPNDAAASFSNALNSFFVQDEYFLDQHNVTLVAGLRYDFFTTDDRPVFNPAFTAANGGLRNDGNIDGLRLLMPRFGVTWGAADNLRVRGSAGRYSGGNPNVWISNAWSNDGVTNVQRTVNIANDSRSLFDGSIPLIGQRRPGYDVPQEMFNFVASTTPANANRSFVVLMDPDYKQPSEWKYAAGLTYNFPSRSLQVDVDFMHTEMVDSAHYVDLSQSIVGTTRAGGPIYAFTNGSDNLMLTNSSFGASSDIFSVALRKRWGTAIDLSGGYAFTAAKDISPMTSSVAVSNFENLATTDINNPRPGTSNYEVPHAFTFRGSHGRNWFGAAETRFTVHGFIRQGQPQSIGMSSDDLEGDGFFGRHLLYVPDGASDPNVVFGPRFPVTDFFSFVEREGLKPGFVPRNSKHADWSTRIDLGIHQDVPTGVGRTHGRIFFRMYNFTNFLNKGWGKVNDAVFFTPIFVESSVNAAGQYVFEEFEDIGVNDLLENRSLWEARLGFEFRF